MSKSLVLALNFLVGKRDPENMCSMVHGVLFHEPLEFNLEMTKLEEYLDSWIKDETSEVGVYLAWLNEQSRRAFLR